MNLPTDYLEILKGLYPKRAGDNGWFHVRTAVPRRITEGATWERILAGTRNYARFCEREGKVGSAYVKQAQTFYGPSAYFDEWAEQEEVRSPAQLEAELKWIALEERAKAMGFTTVDRGRGYQIAEFAIAQEEKKRAAPLVAALKLKVVS
jgi:hypothetical protein